METFKTLPLEYENGKKFHYNERYLHSYCQELLTLIAGEDYMHNLNFAKKMMMGQEIKSNNTIEGINDDLSMIDEVIKTKTFISSEEKKRIINLYHGYQYILTHKDIDKDSLKELYAILSEGLLLEEDAIRMGKYYRKGPVYILKGRHIGDDMYSGKDADALDYYMDQFFSYVNSHEESDEMSNFIKSQIMHFYFVYLHPYFDINGRTSRTVAMWYLLNNSCYPYLVFNQAIAFDKQEYERVIIAGREHGDLTLFLKYMLTHVERELEKKYVINSIRSNCPEELTKEDCQLINYILTMNAEVTVNDLTSFYNAYNPSQRPRIILSDRVEPLIEKGVILKRNTTKGYIHKGSNLRNVRLALNKDFVDVSKEKVKHLSLGRHFI